MGALRNLNYVNTLEDDKGVNNNPNIETIKSTPEFVGSEFKILSTGAILKVIGKEQDKNRISAYKFECSECGVCDKKIYKQRFIKNGQLPCDCKDKRVLFKNHRKTETEIQEFANKFVGFEYESCCGYKLTVNDFIGRSHGRYHFKVYCEGCDQEYPQTNDSIILGKTPCDCKTQPFTKQKGFVYLMQNKALKEVKVGISSNPSKRVIGSDIADFELIFEHELQNKQVAKDHEGWIIKLLGQLFPNTERVFLGHTETFKYNTQQEVDLLCDLVIQSLKNH